MSGLRNPVAQYTSGLAGMFPIKVPSDDNVIRPLDDDDQRTLVGLTHKYGLSSLICALSALGESCKYKPGVGATRRILEAMAMDERTLNN